MSTNDGGAAFPRPAEYDQHGQLLNHASHGMTLRDYFAAKALPCAWDAYDRGYWVCDAEDINRTVAEGAYQMADAMLKARAKEPA
jgi:hypothetical protein